MNTPWSNDALAHNVWEARWADEGLDPVARTTVGSLVPTMFDAYARILYPVHAAAADGSTLLVRWSDIARHNGTVTHGEMELHALGSNPRPTPAKPVAPWEDQLTEITQVLEDRTSTPDDCWFAVWEGNTALDDIRDTTPTATIAGYNYFLLTGPVSRATDTLSGLSPNLWWPADHAWCVAQHFDFPCAYVGGSAATIADILALEDIEAWPARVDQVVTADNDQVNRATP